MKVKDVIAIMEKHFPITLAEKWDNPGLQLGSADQEVNRMAVALDADAYSIDQALKRQADLLITHHPLFFQEIKSIDYQTPQGQLIYKLVQGKLSVYTAHTNLDSAPEGLNQHLAQILGLLNIELLGGQQEGAWYKLVVFVPHTHLQPVREVMHIAGAGHIGNYSDCSFAVAGTGTYRPLKGTRPYQGTVGQLEFAEEYRLETIIAQEKLNQVVDAMLAQHPYEEVAYEVLPLVVPARSFSFGRLGELAEPLPLKKLTLQVKEKLNIPSLRAVGNPDLMVRKVAVASGSGSILLHTAVQKHADVFISGDIKYHEAQEGLNKGIAVIDAGHQGTEAIVVPFLASLLREELSENHEKYIIDQINAPQIFNYYG